DREIRSLDQDQLLALDLLALPQPVDGRPADRPLDGHAGAGGFLGQEQESQGGDSHSYLTAATGSIFAARRAGIHPARMLTATANSTDPAASHNDTWKRLTLAGRSNRGWAIMFSSFPISAPPASPTMPPRAPIAPASARKRRPMSPLRAPRAFMIPISRVRSRTAMAIVFAIPK